VTIRVGIGGWVFDPWRETFYPPDLPKTGQLAYAGQHVGTIEINATFYRGQSPDTFRKWADSVPDEFRFSVKAHRVTTHRKQLADATESIERFLTTGPLALGDKLGAFLWQMPTGKKFDADDVEAFCAALPHELDGRKLRHVIETGHPSFGDSAFVDIARRHRIAICMSDSPGDANIFDVTADFVYARLQCSQADETAGYPPVELDAWTQRVSLLAAGKAPADLPTFTPAPAKSAPRDCFIYFISGAKERNPAAAMALAERLRG
jgi:uncharacterized protein YecE (DUF72 family)